MRELDTWGELNNSRERDTWDWKELQISSDILKKLEDIERILEMQLDILRNMNNRQIEIKNILRVD